MRARTIAVILASAFAIGAITVAAVGAIQEGKPYGVDAAPPFGGSGSVHGPRPAPDCHEMDPACPPDEPATKLTDSMTFVDQARFEPPQDLEPTISGKEAENIAWQEDGTGGGAKGQQAILAVMPAGGNIPTDTLVWLVRYTGLCLVPSLTLGHADETPECTNQTWTTVIDATSGEFIMGYTDG